MSDSYNQRHPKKRSKHNRRPYSDRQRRMIAYGELKKKWGYDEKDIDIIPIINKNKVRNDWKKEVNKEIEEND